MCQHSSAGKQNFTFNHSALVSLFALAGFMKLFSVLVINDCACVTKIIKSCRNYSAPTFWQILLGIADTKKSKTQLF